LEAAVEEARGSERRLRELLDGLDLVVWEADARGLQFSYVSRRAESMLGHPLDRWLEPGFWLSAVERADRPQAVALRQEAMADGHEHTAEYRALAADDRT